MFTSIPSFFKSGLTIAYLNAAGTDISFSGLFTIAVITGRTLLTHCLSRYVGIGSSSHDFDGDFTRRFQISSLDAGASRVICLPVNLTSVFLTFPTLSLVSLAFCRFHVIKYINVIRLPSIDISNPRMQPSSSFLNLWIFIQNLLLKRIATPLWFEAYELIIHSPSHWFLRDPGGSMS